MPSIEVEIQGGKEISILMQRESSVIGDVSSFFSLQQPTPFQITRTSPGVNKLLVGTEIFINIY